MRLLTTQADLPFLALAQNRWKHSRNSEGTKGAMTKRGTGAHLAPQIDTSEKLLPPTLQSMAPPLRQHSESRKHMFAQSRPQAANALHNPSAGSVRPRLLLSAIEHGKAGKVSALIRRIHPAQQGIASLKPLHIACRAGHVRIVQVLLRLGFDPNQPAADGTTPLMAAASAGHGAVARKLLRHRRCQPNQARPDGVTALYMAAQEGHADVVAALLNDTRIEVNRAAVDGATPLFCSAQNGDAQTVRILMAHPAIAPNRARNDGATPLLIAVQKGNRATVQALLKHPDTDVD
jgi:hypothetical protein